MKKKLIIMILTISLLFSGKVTAYAFSDISESDYFYKEVIWGVNNGIVNGLSEKIFGPSLSCTRGQIASFIWRAEGKQKPEK